ncbi:hypothetical protein [Solidesulfovibrio sp.]|jgi:hypothetical protein|uniref:hypothetical protein n=1 Tax=Solidesulfovibrio sp. TaxID=2910990 RepID=UPI000EE1568A|nr:hypothetical protein [Solidesulfovibrio sp.]MEA5089952.1 hypothetical protein [Solidesulfovibrio sp.]HCR13525.1 hypothetical protein [Desulfovibrio sp.]HML61553.1 hypothetical protein [Solidesulfovibrio sp.]
MRKKSLLLLAAAIAATAFLSTGCVRRTAPTAAKAPVAGDAATSAVAFLGKTFVVAPFTIPATDADLLAGYLPANSNVPEVVPVHLDAALASDLAGSKQNVLPARMGLDCSRSAPRGEESGRLATMRYWQNVGKCAGADFVLVPQVMDWREREGGEAGATKPASVDLCLTLLDVRTGGIVKKFHFDETQQSLTDNILNAKQFVARNGRWLSAIELAQEGLRKGLAELGL